MSHINQVKVEIRDEAALKVAAERLGLECVGTQDHDLFEREVHGIGFRLPGWRYPVVIDLEKGEAYYDNYEGAWGKQTALDDLVQRYTAALVESQAETMGFIYSEERLENGDLMLQLAQA